MPQTRIHVSAAARQAAYRTRREHARQAALSAKGLPVLPAIASMPGWVRWNASFVAAHQLVAAAVTEMKDYFDDRSENWQESERGEEHEERIASAEAALDSLGELIV